MKINILSTTIVAALAMAPAIHAQDKPAKPDNTGEIHVVGSGSTVTTKSGPNGTVIITGSAQLANPGSLEASGGAVSVDADGTATIIIEADGKKETRTFKLGDGPVKFGTGTLRGFAGPNVGGKETWVGIGLGAPVGDDLRSQLQLKPGEGVTVSAVIPDSPAAKAGIEQHDILVRLDDQVLVTPDQFKALVKMHKPGESAKLTYIRKAERKDAQVTFAEHEAQPEPHDVFRLLEHPEKLKTGKWTERLDGAKERLEGLREKLKDAKEKHPGIVVESKAFVVGPDGKTTAIDGDSKAGLSVVKEALKHLDEAGVLRKEELAKSVEELRKTLEAARSTAKVLGVDLKEDVAKRIQEELNKAGINKEGIEIRIEAARKALENANGSLKSISGELKENLTKELREKLEKSGLNKEQLDAVNKTLEGITETAEQTILKAVQEALKAADKEEKTDGAKQ